MANVRDSDTSLWLHNKLGTSTDSWSSGGGSLCTQLNSEVLRNIEHCFPDLQTQVKLKLLLSFFHIPRRNLEEWKNELEAIIEVASVDSELWVAMLAEVLKTYPATGTLNTEISEFDETRPIFSDMINELKKLVNKHSDLGLLPLECLYLNKTAMNALVGPQPGPQKHFTLKRKPKSAALRADLLTKAAELAANTKKSVATTVPVRSRGMPRKMTDTTPLKGLPSRAMRTAIIRPVTVAPPPPPPVRPHHARSGIKLLDIADQPATLQQIKKRRKLEMEEGANAKKLPPAAPASPPPPDYAKGLNSYTLPKPEITEPVEPAVPPPSSPPPLVPVKLEPKVEPKAEPPRVPSPAPPPTPAAAPPTPTQPPPLARLEPRTLITQEATIAGRPIILQQTTGAKPIILSQQPKLVIAGQPGQKQLLVTGAPGTILSSQNILKSPAGVPLILQQGGKTVVLTNVKQVTPGVVQQTPRIQAPALHTTVLQQGTQTNTQQQQIQQPVQQQIVQPVQQTVQQTVQPAAQPAAQPVAAQPQQRRGLSLTREQMLEAQDMFRNANRVTRPEKALILGFMAGSRDNPCPNLGNIVTIKLSENIENVLQSDDTYLTMLSEMHFQMNYNNGQWTRLKKYRPIDGVLPQKIPPGSTVITSNNTLAPVVSISNQSIS